MSMKILMNVMDSPWFKKRHLDNVQNLKNEISALKKVLMTSSREVCLDYNSNLGKLKQSITNLDRISENPLSGFVCARDEAREAYLEYNDRTISEYYILQNMGCSALEMDFHLENLLKVFETEGNEYQQRLVLEDGV